MNSALNPALILDNYRKLCDDIARAEERAGRQAGEVRLLIASKTQTAEQLVPLLEAGHRLFGENRVQEAQAKWPALKERWPDVELHLIGPLQSNKTKEAIALFDVIQSLDREKLARAIAGELAYHPRNLPLFVQVNTGEEEQKAGISPQDTSSFIALCRDELGLTIEGLMCIPPLDEEPAMHFALLHKLADKNALTGLSMGMSADFQTAIALGATHVRVGSALFGERF